MHIYDVMRTTFAARDFEPESISEEMLYRILDNARFAPSGGNRQGWRVINVRDGNKRNSIESLMEPAAQRYFAQKANKENPWNSWLATTLTDQEIADSKIPMGFLNKIAQAPTLLLVLLDLRFVASFDINIDRVGVVSGASVYPFVWNILLSARAEGFGGTLTTFLTAAEAEVKALFDIPDYMAVCGLLPMGKPIKQLTKLTRKSVDTFAWHDEWNGPAINGTETAI